jgi:hypothetical protein
MHSLSVTSSLYVAGMLERQIGAAVIAARTVGQSWRRKDGPHFSSDSSRSDDVNWHMMVAYTVSGVHIGFRSFTAILPIVRPATTSRA